MQEKYHLVILYNQETKISEMVALCVDLQDQLLDNLASQHPGNKEFLQDLQAIREPVSATEDPGSKEAREKAEQRVLMFVEEKGERLGHGDLLTFQKVIFG